MSMTSTKGPNVISRGDLKLREISPRRFDLFLARTKRADHALVVSHLGPEMEPNSASVKWLLQNGKYDRAV